MPVNINLLPDEVIARGVTPPAIGNLPDAFWSGQEQAQKLALQNLFAGGIPHDQTGAPDWNRAAEMLLRAGGAGQLQNAIGLTNLQALRNLPPISSLEPSPQPQQTPRVPSIQRTGGLPVDQGDGEPKLDVNVVQKSEVPGSAQIIPGPTETTPFPEPPPVPPVPPGSAAAATAPRFAPPPTNAPVSGPPTDRFQVAQTTPSLPLAPMPGIPTQQQGKYTEAEAIRQETIRDKALDAAKLADNLGNKGNAETYRARAAQAAAYAKDIREGLIGAQRKQAETQIEQEKGIIDESRKGYKESQDIQYRVGLINESIQKLGPQWMGSGANARAGFARAYNTTLNFVPDTIRAELNLQPFDPAKVATWEDFNKQSLNLGFALARTLGAREAMQIVQQATASVPNSEQSYWGAQLVSSAMKQAAQREIDYHQYVLQLRRSGKSVLDADVAFNQTHPVQSYVDKAISVVPPVAPPMQQRQVGKPYQTPRGFGIWRGNNTWEFP